MKRFSLEQIADRNRAGRCARDLGLSGFRRKDVLSYWRAMDEQYGLSFQRWAHPRIVAARRDAFEVPQ